MSTRQTPDSPSSAAPLTAPDHVLEYRVGNPHFHGATTVRVKGDGEAEVSFERGGKKARYQGALSPALLRHLRSHLAAHPIASYRSRRKTGVPDEARIHFMLSAGGPPITRELWDGERRDIEPLDDLIDLLNQIASHVSGGKVTY